jgi:hypothetical protein
MRGAAYFLSIVVFCVFTGWSDDFSVHGSLSNRYKFRSSGAADDHDLETIATIDFGEPLVDKYSGSVQAGGVFDLDGRDSANLFPSVYDNFDSNQSERIYHAYIDANDIQPFKFLRLGRQARYEFEPLYFDGLYAEWRKAKGFTMITYGGVPVHLYETRLGHQPGDWVVGGAIEIDPIAPVRFRIDAVQLNDKVTGFRSNFGDQNDTLFGTSLWWDVSPHVMISSRFTSFLDQPRDLDFQSRFRFPEQTLFVQAKMYTLLHDYGVRVIDLDGYGFLGSYEPFVEGGITVTKGIGEHFNVDTGFFLRRLIEKQIASAFNHGYQRYFLTGSTSDFPISGMSLSATGDYYHGVDNVLKDDVFGSSFNIDQALFERKLRLSGGTAYYLYRYNLLTGNESTDVRTLYAKVTAKLLKEFELQTGYEFETSDLENFHTVTTKGIWKF